MVFYQLNQFLPRYAAYFWLNILDQVLVFVGRGGHKLLLEKWGGSAEVTELGALKTKWAISKHFGPIFLTATSIVQRLPPYASLFITAFLKPHLREFSYITHCLLHH